MNDRLNPLAPDYSHYQLVSVSLLRVLVGWHLLYEGMAKLAIQTGHQPLICWIQNGYFLV